MNDPEDRRDDDMKMLGSHVSRLCEHFDTVQIFVTRHQGGSSMTANRGGGNWYARFGQVRQWLIQEEERAKDHVRVSNDE